MNSDMKILAIDIETCPSLAYIWSLWDDHTPLARLIESGEMISFAAKWIGEPDDTMEFRSVHHDGHKKMVKRIWKLMDEADVVLHFNGKRFDVPHIQREFLELGLTPPSPFKQIDLLDTCKSQFKFVSNKLEYVAKKLGLKHKISHEGFSLWVKCMAGDNEAWESMREYNIGDVVILEELYEKLRPWIKTHPSFAAHTGEHVCPKCGSKDITRYGVVFLSTGRYQGYKCKSCGGRSRATKRLGDAVKITQVT
jgi:uncharacterized protein